MKRSQPSTRPAKSAELPRIVPIASLRDVQGGLVSNFNSVNPDPDSDPSTRT